MLFSGGQALDHSPADYADRLPVLGSSSSLYASQESVKLLEEHATYGAVYRSQLWVAVLVNKLARAQARLPYKTYVPTSGGRKNTADSPFGRLMANPLPGHGRVFSWLWTCSTREVHGEAIWIKVRNPTTKLPVALWPMHPANLDVRRRKAEYDADGRLLRAAGVEYVWKVRGSANQELAWDADDVVHFKGYNPDTIHRGMSALEPLRRSLLAEQAVQVAQESFWRRGARPSVLLNHPKELGAGPAERLRAQWESLHGGAANWGKTAILEEGMTAQVVQLTAAEMQMIESRKISREEACSIYDVPPPVVHILDRATFSNITEQMRSMYRDTMGSRLAEYESVMDAQVADEFGGGAYGKFLLDEVLRGDFEKRAEAYAKALYYGWMTPKEVRTAEDLPDAGPDADQLFVSAAMVPLKVASQRAPAPLAGTTAPATAKGLRSAVGRLGRAENLEDVDLAHVIRGLDPGTANAVALHLSHAVIRGDDLPGLRAALADDIPALAAAEEG